MNILALMLTLSLLVTSILAFTKPCFRRNLLSLKSTFTSMNIAEGLDAETLNALGDVQELNEVMEHLIKHLMKLYSFTIF